MYVSTYYMPIRVDILYVCTCRHIICLFVLTYYMSVCVLIAPPIFKTRPNRFSWRKHSNIYTCCSKTRAFCRWTSLCSTQRLGNHTHTHTLLILMLYIPFVGDHTHTYSLLILIRYIRFVGDHTHTHTSLVLIR